MAPKREATPPLPGDDSEFRGDFSDERRALVVRSDGARKRGSRKYKIGEPIPAAWKVRKLPEFDRLRREREVEIRRRQQLRLRNGEGSSSAGASSSSAASGAPPPEDYDPEHFGVTLGPEDFVPDEQMERQLAAAMMRSKYEQEEKAAAAKVAAEINQGLLEQALVISTLPPVVDLVTDSDEE